MYLDHYPDKNNKIGYWITLRCYLFHQNAFFNTIINKFSLAISIFCFIYFVAKVDNLRRLEFTGTY